MTTNILPPAEDKPKRCYNCGEAESACKCPAEPMPRFLLDIDGVCADFLGSALPVIERISGQRYTPDDFPTWDLWDVVPREHKTPTYNEFKAPGFCASLAPYPGTREGVAALRAIADVHVVTSPIHGPHWYYERVEWCARHLRLRPNDVTQTGQKAHVRGDYLLEDKPSAVEAWAAAHPLGMGLLWSQPYNRGSDVDRIANVRRVHGWGEVIKIVASGRSES